MWNVRKYIKIDTFYASSQLCSVCGYQNPDTKDLSVRTWICPKCGAEHDKTTRLMLKLEFDGVIDMKIREVNENKKQFIALLLLADEQENMIDMVYEAQRKIIMEIAEKESCVIIGRNADFILKDRDDVLNVFIHGDMPEKTQRIIDLYNVEEKEAVKMMADTDKRRMTNYNFYTEQKWGKASNYTLCLNSSQLGYDRCERIIMECSK